MASLIVRNPDVVRNKLRSAGESFREILRRDQQDYESARGPNDEHTIDGFMDRAFPGFADDIGITVIPDLINLLTARIAKEMEWLVISTDEAPFDLLIGDRPVIATEEIAHEKCIIALPISSRRIFLASRPSSEWNLIQDSTPVRLARAVNIETVGTASKEVYAFDGRHQRFVENRLRRLRDTD